MPLATFQATRLFSPIPIQPTAADLDQLHS